MNDIEPIDTDSTTSVPRTSAYASFDLNTDRLMCFIQLMGRGVQGLMPEASLGKIRNNLFASIDDLVQKLNIKETSSGANKANSTAGQITKIVQESSSYTEAISSYAQLVNTHISGLKVGIEWMPVLIVTIVESYLLDVLVYAASSDPSLMKKSEMTASYSEMKSASSLEELLQSLRYQWARKFITEGGPKYWIGALKKMGARGYNSALAEEMETLWGIRHLTVHSIGICTPDFVRRHPDFGVAVGEKIEVKLNQVVDWTEQIYHFVDVTDTYFAQRCKLTSRKT